MLKTLVVLAAASANPLDQTPTPDVGGGGTNNLMTSQMRDVLLVCGAALAMALVLFLWAYITRKDRQKVAAAARGSRLLSRPERSSSEHHGRKVRIRKRRREHPDNLPRNPTLAEAGGLPPLRADEPEAPSPEPSAPPAAPRPPEVPPQTQMG